MERGMRQGIQSTIANDELRTYGCYFFCILRQVEIEHHLEFDDRMVIILFEECKRKGFIDDMCFIKNPVAVANRAMSAGINNHYTKIEAPENPPDKDTFTVCLKKPMYTHFVLSHKGQIWDSLDSKRPGAVGYAPASYRVIS